MTDWNQLREVEDQVAPPAFESLASTARQRDRRARTGLLAAGLALVIGVGVGVRSRDDDGTVQPAQDPSISEPGVLALPDNGADAVLDAGRYRVSLSDTLAYDIDLPQGTIADGGKPLYIQANKTIIKSEIAGTEYGVPTNPCAAVGDITPAGPTVEDLVTAIRNEPTYRIGRSQPVTIGGARGQHLQIRIRAGYDATACDEEQLGLPGNPATHNNMEPGYFGHWWFLDVEGQRVVIQTLCAGCDTATAERMNPHIENITFTTTP